ncbi:hypothetical protein K438DRAFT_1783746 [Mycena galopus ATCC 62051]|nr:hypothetical protein K438DRAFT_1783746 [Mycena galopus ATCC 62051]
MDAAQWGMSVAPADDAGTCTELREDNAEERTLAGSVLGNVFARIRQWSTAIEMYQLSFKNVVDKRVQGGRGLIRDTRVKMDLPRDWRVSSVTLSDPGMWTKHTIYVRRDLLARLLALLLAISGRRGRSLYKACQQYLASSGARGLSSGECELELATNRQKSEVGFFAVCWEPIYKIWAVSILKDLS